MFRAVAVAASLASRSQRRHSPPPFVDLRRDERSPALPMAGSQPGTVVAVDSLLSNGLSYLANLASIVDQPAAPPVFALSEELLADMSALAADVVSMLMQPTSGESLSTDMARLAADIATNPLSGQIADFLVQAW